MTDRNLAQRSSAAEVTQFLAKVNQTPAASARQGRLVFALDATASRQATWDEACQLQGEMFVETAALGTLAIQLVWYRGFGEFRAHAWVQRAQDLLNEMLAVQCQGGRTQIGKVLRHAVAETRRHKINALVFVGDCVEEPVDELAHLAGQLGVLGVPVFVFHEGHEPNAAHALRQIATLSRGVYCVFDAGSAAQLRELLRAVAVYATGGKQALTDFSRRHGRLARHLTQQL